MVNVSSNTPASPTPLTPLQLFELFWNASRCTAWAISMGAIAIRESRGIPTAFNGNVNTGDRSYGLVQINMLNQQVADFLDAGLLKGKPETALLDAATNASAAWDLTCSTPAHLVNMNLLWYIQHTDGPYKADYESHLPAMQAAALQSKLAWIPAPAPPSSSTPAQVV